MTNQFTPAMQRLIDAVLTTPGDTAPATRRVVAARAAAHGGRPSTGSCEEVPMDLTRYVDKVARCAYKVTDKDIEALREVDYSEDAIFEITLSAALGAGLARLERGLAALQGDEA